MHRDSQKFYRFNIRRPTYLHDTMVTRYTSALEYIQLGIRPSLEKFHFVYTFSELGFPVRICFILLFEMNWKKKEVTKKMVRITMEVKKEIVEKYEDGLRIGELSVAFRIPRSTVSSIIKNKEVIKSANVAKGVKSLCKQRSETLEHVEKLLLIWITEKQRSGDSISEAMICEKAKLLHGDLLRDAAGTSRGNETFKASHGWFDNFKKRTGLHGVVKQRMNEDVAHNFVVQFREYVKTEGFVPEQVFNLDETVLFWKEMTCTAGKNTLREPVKEKLTVLLCANASGDYKVKPLVVYHCENLRECEEHNVQRTQLPVMCRSGSNTTRLTREYFSEWFHTEFGPSVRSYLEEKQLPLKAVLIMDNAPAHPPTLQDCVLPEFDFITVKFLPCNTPALIQPMNQQIITSFKKLYTKALLQKCYEVTYDKKTTIKEFCQDFTLLHSVTLIDKAWLEVPRRTMNSAWKNLWPEAVTGRDFDDFEDAAVDDIVSIGRSMGLDVSHSDVKELVDDHGELTTKDLQELEKEERKKNRSEPTLNRTSDSEKEVNEPPTALIKEILDKWMDVKNFAERYHPKKVQTIRNSISWNDQTMSYFRNILRRQSSSFGFTSTADGSDTKEKKLEKERETVPEFLIPEILLEVDMNHRAPSFSTT